MGTRGFVLLWSAQLVSIIGSALTGFVLGVWTYERSGSATQFALIMLSGAIPALLIAPFAGAL
ncbi:MFS transporter, partial [Amycolatopsis sp. NPDC000740]